MIPTFYGWVNSASRSRTPSLDYGHQGTPMAFHIAVLPPNDSGTAP